MNGGTSKRRNSTNTGNTLHVLLPLLGLALLVIGCTNPMAMDLENSGNDSRGGIILSVGSGGSEGGPAFTVFPGLQKNDIKSYRITLTDGPARDMTMETESQGGAFPSPLELRDIVPGTWTVVVTGFDGPDPGDARPIVRGAEQGVSVEAGTNTSVDSITLTYLDNDDPGYLDFAITWPEDEKVDRVAYRIETLDGDAIAENESEAFDEIDGEQRLSVTIADEMELEAEVYWVSVRFDRYGDDDDPEVTGASTWVVHELVHISPNLTTSETVHLDQIPLEVRIANEIDGKINDFVDDDDNFEVDEEFGFIYEGTGGGSMSIDTGEIDVSVIITFKIRNEFEVTGGDGLNSPYAAERFESGSNVEVSLDGELTGTYYPPYPYDGTDPETDDLIPASDPENVSLDDLQHVIDNFDSFDEDLYGELDEEISTLEGTVITDGEFHGFLEVSFELPAHVDEVLFQFGGGRARHYTFGDFSATLSEED